MNEQARTELLRSMTREMALACDANGVVQWADPHTLASFGDLVGQPLWKLVAPGSEQRFEQLLREGSLAPKTGVELSLLRDGRPTTVHVGARPFQDGVLLLASLVPQDYCDVLAQYGTEIGEMHRHAERSRREIAGQRDEIQRQLHELVRLGQELGESNRGLVTLHAELDDRSDTLRRATEVKTRLVANVSHEFRTPLNSILGLSKLLLDRLDGDLTDEQEKQVRFIRQSAEALSELVNDLLDLSKIEAGKLHLRPRRFTVDEMLAGLRGMMRPLVGSSAVSLEIEPAPAGIPALETDEGKVAQILRNLVSNALKFTERGEVRVSVSATDEKTVTFTVRDTGIGIAPEDQARVFDEFTQIDGPLQRKVKGTGLGLSLSRRLAALLGGTIELESAVGRGSTFTVRIPRVHDEVQAMHALEERSRQIDPRRAPILVVEDDRQTMFLYEKYLTGSGFQVVPARSIEDAREAVSRVVPAAIVLDVFLEGETTWGFLAELKESPRTRQVPVMIVTVVDRAQKARALGADEFWLKPVDPEQLRTKLAELARRGPLAKVLVIDDDEVSRYVMRRLLEGTPYAIVEAATGAEGVRLARLERPQVIFLDFVLGEATAFDVLDDLKLDPITRNIPVILQTSRHLSPQERERLARETAAILSKQSLSREVAIARVREALIGAGVTNVEELEPRNIRRGEAPQGADER